MSILSKVKSNMQHKAAVAKEVSKASFLMRGNRAKEAFAKEEAVAAMNADRAFRFFIKEGESKQIIFLDGAYVDGALDATFFYDHAIKVGGKWQNFCCTQDTEPCPLCMQGENANFVGVLSLLDFTPYKDKKGNEHQYTKRILVAKRGTLKILQNKAQIYGGLTGLQMTIFRSGDKSPAVGNDFNYEERWSFEELKATFKDDALPFDYSKALGYLPASELVKLGFGSGYTGGLTIGAEVAPIDESFDEVL